MQASTASGGAEAKTQIDTAIVQAVNLPGEVQAAFVAASLPNIPCVLLLSNEPNASSS